MNGESGGETRCWIEVMYDPGFRGLCVSRQADELRWLTGYKRDLYHVEQIPDAFARGLEPGFLACPEIKESEAFLLRWQFLKCSAFPGGEKTVNELGGVIQRANSFDIDTEHPGAGQGKQSEIFGMGQVEIQEAVRESAG